MELLHASTLLIFALTSLALIGLAWVLGQATESLGLATRFIALYGKSNWLEGAMLCGLYIIAALAFFFSP